MIVEEIDILIHSPAMGEIEMHGTRGLDIRLYASVAKECFQRPLVGLRVIDSDPLLTEGLYLLLGLIGHRPVWR